MPPEIPVAFAELGIPSTTPAEQVRRAYLRTIKARKPEVDPEGFRRAREAYELLTAWFEASARVQPRTAAPTSDARLVPELAPPEPIHAVGWAAVLPLLSQDNIEGARERIRQLLVDGVQPPDKGRLLLLLLDLQRARPGADARRTLQVFLEWVERAQVELAFSENLERWLLIRELPKLPPNTPGPFESAVAEWLMGGSGGFEALRLKVEAFTRANPQQADDFILALSAAERLHTLLARSLNIELLNVCGKSADQVVARAVPPPPEPLRRRAIAWTVAVLAIIIGLSAALVSRAYQDDFDLKPPGASLPATPIVLSDLEPEPQDSEVAIVASPKQRAVVAEPAELGALCRLSARDCLAARLVLTHLEGRACERAVDELDALAESPTLTEGGEARDALKATMRGLSRAIYDCNRGRE